MALLFADGFEHYGTGSSGGGRMTSSGAYALGGSSAGYPNGAYARTGNYALRPASSSSWNIARNIGGPHTTVGVGCGLYLTQLTPEVAITYQADNYQTVLGVRLNTDGSISIIRGNNPFYSAAVIASTPPGLFTTGAWNHIELKGTIDAVVGGFELRVNGVTALAMSNINLGSILATRIGITTRTTNAYFDDFIIWNDQGDAPTDFVGPARVITVYPASDTPVDDFTINGAASGYECINQAVEDGDTTYIEGVNLGDASEFGIGTLPPETEGIVGVFIPALAKLSAAGTGNLKVSMMSGVSEAAGFDGPITQAYAYRDSAFGVNPATDSPWDKASLEAARLRFEKTA